MKLLEFLNKIDCCEISTRQFRCESSEEVIIGNVNISGNLWREKPTEYFYNNEDYAEEGKYSIEHSYINFKEIIKNAETAESYYTLTTIGRVILRELTIDSI